MSWQAGLGHGGHTCSGEGGGLPGLQLLVPGTDTASPATAGPEVGQPGEQSPGCPRAPWGSVTAAADAWRRWGGAEEGSALPSPQSSGETPGLPWVGAAWTWLSTPSHGPGILPPT